jgi:DNA-directed RNA polymerase III subunit RPC6
MIDLVAINARVRISGISKVELSLEELELVLQTLVYDGRLEEVRTSVLSYTGHTGTGQTMYKVSKNINPPNFLTETPCGVCPVSSQCCEEGVISPTTCVYITNWLAIPEDHATNENYSW